MTDQKNDELKTNVVEHIKNSRARMRFMFVANLAIMAMVAGTLYSVAGAPLVIGFVGLTVVTLTLYGFMAFRFGIKIGNLEGIEVAVKAMPTAKIKDLVEQDIVEKCMTSFKEEHGLETDDEAFDLIEKMLAAGETNTPEKAVSDD